MISLSRCTWQKNHVIVKTALLLTDTYHDTIPEQPMMPASETRVGEALSLPPSLSSSLSKPLTGSFESRSATSP